MAQQSSSRRQFIKSGSLALSAGALAPYWLTASTARADHAPSDRPVFATLGTGDRCWHLTEALEYGDCAAVCDVDSRRIDIGKQKFTNRDGRVPDGTDDYRRVLDRKDIDAVLVVTTDHWHTKIAIEALLAGKDVFCEKPLTLTIDEGIRICKAVKQTGRVFQVGTQQRTDFDRLFLKAVTLVRLGRIGDVKRVWVSINGAPTGGPFKTSEPPKELNWERWLGQAPLVDYITERCHYEFRWWYEYSGGKLTDWGAHHVDIAQWAIGLDNTSAVRVEPLLVEHPSPMVKGMPTLSDRYNTATKFKLKCTFANGVEMRLQDNVDEEGIKFDNGVLWEGSKGNLFVNRGRLTGRAVDALAEEPLTDEQIMQTYKGRMPTSHMGDFFACIKSRNEPISDVFSHHRMLTTCHLSNIAMRLGRAVQFDPESQQVIGDEEAQSMTSRVQRKGYELPTV